MDEYILDLAKLPSVLLTGHSVCQSGWNLVGRILDESEVIVVYEGFLHCKVAHNNYLLKEGDACLIPAGVPVDQYADHGSCRFFMRTLMLHLFHPFRICAIKSFQIIQIVL